MPIYEYRCSSCGHELERLQRISEAPLTDCPECHKPAMRRLISPAGFRLKGSGWYETDFKRDRKRNVAEAASEGDRKAAKKDDSATPGDSGAAESGKSAAGKDANSKDSKATAA